MSAVHKHFVAGQLKYMRELCALVAPTVNSYSRLNAGGLAPTAANWGIDNRTCALRVIPGSNQSQRVEYRLAGADGNPYLVSAAALASGLAGIREELELIEPVAGDAHQRDRDPPGERQLPATLREAAAALRTSDLAKAALGEEFVEHFAATREWESRQFERMITTWELSRYFEVI